LSAPADKDSTPALRHDAFEVVLGSEPEQSLAVLVDVIAVKKTFAPIRHHDVEPELAVCRKRNSLQSPDDPDSRWTYCHSGWQCALFEVATPKTRGHLAHPPEQGAGSLSDAAIQSPP
jgi:hypothetical protein